MPSPFVNVEAAIKEFQQGKMLILVDDEDRENEGDLIIAAEKTTSETINFMAKFGRGLICMPMASTLIDKLELPMMVEKNGSPYETAFTVSIEASVGVSTGISAADRAKTVQAAIADKAKPQDLVSPGHVFPLRAKEGGVIVRQGQTEGSVDLAKLAGLKPAAVICEIINEDGTMARRKELEKFAKAHDIRIVTIEELQTYRLAHEQLVDELASSPLSLEELGDFTIKVFGNRYDTTQHIALIKMPLLDKPLVRVHSECLTGDVFGSARCDCGGQLNASIEKIAKEGGVLLYMRQEGRGIGLVNKIKAYALQQEKGLDTVEANNHLGFPADKRDYASSAQILRYLGVTDMQLLTNNPKKIHGLTKYGLSVTSRIPLRMPETKANQTYLRTKEAKLGHLFNQS